MQFYLKKNFRSWNDYFLEGTPTYSSFFFLFIYVLNFVNFIVWGTLS